MLTQYTMFVKITSSFNARRKSDRAPRRFVNKQNTSYYMCAESSCVCGDFFYRFSSFSLFRKKGVKATCLTRRKFKTFFSRTLVARPVRWFNNAFRPFRARDMTPRQFVIRARAFAPVHLAGRREEIASAISDFHFPTVPFVGYGPERLYSRPVVLPSFVVVLVAVVTV